ncbi:MAG TPA: VCBS repeat-containing protein [Puia sp.]|nr:VCBS repeat-containing protein [Puia sp.]
MFKQLTSDRTGIHFANRIDMNDSINPLEIENVFNGGGVGVGDFNNDGKPDLYFTGNLVSNKLYLNEGDFNFRDVTQEAGVGGEGRWSRGVAVVDINNDGWQDIYVSCTLKKDPKERRNLLYINQGLDKNGIPHFKEMAAEYGLTDTVHSTQAVFFDYDNDGDLDLYLVVNEVNKSRYPNTFHPVMRDGSNPSTGRLYRNDWSDSLHHPVFTDVTKQAGLLTEGYGHSAVVTDINGDGWKDIYVTNDFIPNDLLWINNHDGTFTESLSKYFKHTSANAMGCDIADINNDGLQDVVALDMNPEDNYRKKMMMNPGNYQNYIYTEEFGYNYQYVRNTFQLNQGPRVGPNDSIGPPVFSEIGFYSGIAETDWSWTPLVMDFDNDGYRDLIVTNGYPRDVTDHDFIAFSNRARNLASRQLLLSQIPEVKLHNYAFRNKGDLSFENVTAKWGMMTPTFSNGAAYVDLDGDGDMDVVINNINDSAMVYRNMARESDPQRTHYLQVRLQGDSPNVAGLGSMVELHYDHGKKQVYEYSPYRGYLSTDQLIAHFGLGGLTTVDSVLVRWPDGRMQVQTGVTCDQVLTMRHRDANARYVPSAAKIDSNAVFRDITDSAGINFVQAERDYIDFNVQMLLPHKFSQYGPGIAVGDVDGNGLDDLVVGGSAFHSAQLFLQQQDGRFVQSPLLPDSLNIRKEADDEGVLLFDADGDGDLDLYISSGGDENGENSPAYADRLYLNDGRGHFTLAKDALPVNYASKFCVRAADFNHDGKLDLFISGRVDPGHYPNPVSSFIYRNDSRDGQVRFTDVTETVAKDLQHIGMVCDGVWTDIDGDGWMDLVLAGEYMPLTVLKNNHGVFSDISAGTGVSKQLGWWNSIVAGDFDNDGDIDYVVGNVGLNSFYRASDAYPVRAYGKDFDKNGVYDLIMSCYLPARDGKKKEFPAASRDELLRQMNSLRRKFPTYQSYAVATMDDVLPKAERKGATILQANQFRSCLFRNDGNGHFAMIPLPAQAQLSVLNGMAAGDFDGDGKLDLVISGNDYGTEVTNGRYDALNGLLLKGNGKDSFVAESILQSGIYIPGDGKALVKLRSADGRCLVAAGQNRGPLKLFACNSRQRLVPVGQDAASAVITYADGSKRKEEFQYGCSFLSAGGRFLMLTDSVRSVEITDRKGQTRKLL